MCIIKTNSSLLCHIFTLLALLWGRVVNFCVAFLASIGQRRLISRHWSFGPLPVVKSIYELVPAAQHVQHSGCTRDTFSLDFIAHPRLHMIHIETTQRWRCLVVRWKVEMTEKRPHHPVLAYNCFDICFPLAFSHQLTVNYIISNFIYVRSVRSRARNVTTGSAKKGRRWDTTPLLSAFF